MSRPRGVCPACGRELSLRDDRTMPTHNVKANTSSRAEPERCAGSRQQPDDQIRLLEGSP